MVYSGCGAALARCSFCRMLPRIAAKSWLFLGPDDRAPNANGGSNEEAGKGNHQRNLKTSHAYIASNR